MNKVAIIIGHNERKQGAYALNPIGDYEFTYNGVVGEHMLAMAENVPHVDMQVFRRRADLGGYSSEIKEVYNRVNDWGAKFTMELHFNAFERREVKDGITMGCEMLTSGTIGSEAGARCLLHSTLTMFPALKNRGLREVEVTDRGGPSVWLARGYSVLTEPFFGSDADDVAEIIRRGGQKAIAEANMRGLLSWIKEVA
jgi:N-acetylmuramoyl-L-alanine amidase